MYLIAKDVAIEEKKIEIDIFENLMNEDIFKLSDFEIIIILMKIVWQQKAKATTNKFNKFLNKVSEENDVSFEKCSLQQQWK